VKEDEENVEPWKPRNYDESFHGPTRLREALAYSRNVVTVKLVDAIGVHRVIKFARQMGIKSEMPRDLTIALGTMSVTPLEFVSSFTAFANSGVKMQPIGIKYVMDQRQKVLENNESRGERVLDEQTSYLITSMMKDVVNYGTGWRARALGVPVAGKTGTTNDYMDAWFLGYTTDMVAGVWVGFDEPTSLGPDETGSRAAAPIWVDFMRNVTDRKNPEDFQVPEGIVSRLIDPETGLLANMWTKRAVTEYFIEGTEPKEVSPSIWESGEQNEFAF
jgi:penicillin-binding protein 1A